MTGSTLRWSEILFKTKRIYGETFYFEVCHLSLEAGNLNCSPKGSPMCPYVPIMQPCRTGSLCWNHISQFIPQRPFSFTETVWLQAGESNLGGIKIDLYVQWHSRFVSYSTNCETSFSCCRYHIPPYTLLQNVREEFYYQCSACFHLVQCLALYSSYTLLIEQTLQEEPWEVL